MMQRERNKTLGVVALARHLARSGQCGSWVKAVPTAPKYGFRFTLEPMIAPRRGSEFAVPVEYPEQCRAARLILRQRHLGDFGHPVRG